MKKRERPHLVTEAAISRVDEHKHRQRRYALTMAARIVCLIAAALLARYSVPLAIAVGVLSAVLPWFAVVMANDGPPKNSKRYRRVHGVVSERAIGSGGATDRRVITADSVVIDENGATLQPGERGDHGKQ